MHPPDAPYPAAPAWAGAVTRLPKGRQARTDLATAKSVKGGKGRDLNMSGDRGVVARAGC